MLTLVYAAVLVLIPWLMCGRIYLRVLDTRLPVGHFQNREFEASIILRVNKLVRSFCGKIVVKQYCLLHFFYTFADSTRKRLPKTILFVS